MAKRLWLMGIVEGQHIWVKLDGFDLNVNDALKSTLPGPPRWNAEEGRWQFPIHWDTCTGARKVAEKFNADILIQPALTNWAQGEKAKRADIPDVQSMDLMDMAKVEAEAPALAKALSARPFQTVGVAFAARNKSCLIADQPGLGKTLQAIGAVVESGLQGPILVVAPKAAAQITWPQELARWVPDDEVIVVGSNIKPAAKRDELVKLAGGINHRRVWVVLSPNYVRIKAETDNYGNYAKVNGHKVIKPVGEGLMSLFDIDWASIIVDESHDTLAGATGNKKKQSAQRLGLGALTVRDDGLRIALSGTPFRGKESYLWGQLNWLRPDLYRSYWAWVKKHFNIDVGRFGTTIGAMVDSEGMYEDARTVMIRRTKAEVAKDLPAKAYGGWPLEPGNELSPIAVWLDMDSKQAKAYQGMVKHAAAEIEGGTLMTNGVLAELTRLKQFAGSYGRLDGDTFVPTLPSNKFDWLLEMLDERGINRDMEPTGDIPKVVVVSQFASLIDALAEGFAENGIEVHKFTGATSEKVREAIKDDWQNNPNSRQRVMLLSTKAGGVSLTLDAADEMVILDETWSTSDQEQVEDRIHRLSRMHQVTIWKVFSRNTIEESIARANLTKEFSIKSIIDGERGVEVLKGIFNP
jgi:SNF2 family DNA or RNA helicase